jgi:UDP-2,3-diacylglucosamine pyrophosphatase LpxH
MDFTEDIMFFKSELKLTFERIEEDISKGKFVREFDPDRDKYVFFSDTHKGSGDKMADAFLQNEATFCYALNEYYSKGFTLVQVGDIEECWGFQTRRILKRYKESVYNYEGRFFENKKYFRIYGNHDFKWRKEKKVDKLLQPALSNTDLKLEVFPALSLGEHVVILHGHQGSFNGDRFLTVINKSGVRAFTSLFFRIFGRQKYRASKNAQIRVKRDIYLSKWAKEHGKLLIAGHTHGYWFESKARIHLHIPDIDELEKEIEITTDTLEKLLKKDQIEKIMNLDVKFKDTILSFKCTSHLDDLNTPCYFNIGAGIYSDGMTCIEIEDGAITLVMWKSPHIIQEKDGKTLHALSFIDRPQRVVLFSRSLNHILKQITAIPV